MRQSTPNILDLRKWDAYIRRFDQFAETPGRSFALTQQIDMPDRALVLVLKPTDASLSTFERHMGSLGAKVAFIQFRTYKLTETCFGGVRFWGAKLIVTTNRYNPTSATKRIGWIKAGRMKELFWKFEALQTHGELELLTRL